MTTREKGKLTNTKRKTTENNRKQKQKIKRVKEIKII